MARRQAVIAIGACAALSVSALRAAGAPRSSRRTDCSSPTSTFPLRLGYGRVLRIRRRHYARAIEDDVLRVVNRAGELIGLNFDSAAIIEAMTKVYDTNELVQELVVGR